MLKNYTFLKIVVRYRIYIEYIDVHVPNLIYMYSGLGTFLNPPKSSSALLETCPYLQNAPCTFVDLSYSALTSCTCTSCREEVNVPVSNSAEFFQKSAPWRIVEDFGVVRVNVGIFVFTVFLSTRKVSMFHWKQKNCFSHWVHPKTGHQFHPLS